MSLLLSKCRANVLAGLLGVLMSTMGYAQDGAPAGDAPPAFEEVVVTARRRSENLQTVPLSITAVSAETLEAKSISNSFDLASSTPGLSTQEGNAQRNNVYFFIRGQGSTAGGTPAVVTYFADVPEQINAPTGGNNPTFYDLDSVQVLKGPQGTLFGRSTIGGAVLLTPKAPGNEYDGFLEASFGNYSSRIVTGAMNVPLIEDHLAIRVAGNYSYHYGYTTSTTTGEDLDNLDRSSFRISMLAKPTSWLSNTTIFTDQDIHENDTANLVWHYYPNSVGAYQPLLDTGPSGRGSATITAICNGIGGGQACISSRIAALNAVSSAIASEYARLSSGGSIHQVATSGLTYDQSHTQQIINTTKLDIGSFRFVDHVSFKNIFSMWRSVSGAAQRDVVGTAAPTYVSFNALNYINGSPVDTGFGSSKWGDIWSEEAQLAGKINEQHDWIVGFFRESSSVNQYFNNGQAGLSLGGALSVPLGAPSISSDIDGDYLLRQTGIFGQTTVDLGDILLKGLKFTAGTRYTSVDQKLTDIQTAVLPTGIGAVPNGKLIPASLRQHFDSYTFALDYTIAPNVMAYVTTRKGYKQGGINIASVPIHAALPTSGALPTYLPASVTDYEVGVKADWFLAGIPVRTNIALYNDNFANLDRQTTFFNPLTNSFASQIGNIGKSRARGVELDATLKLMRDLEVSLSYGYIDPKYLRYDGTVINVMGEVIPKIDTPFSETPKHKIDALFQYSVPVRASVGGVNMGLDASYQTKTYIGPDDELLDPLSSVQPGYALLHARLDWNNIMGNPVDMSFYVRNLTDHVYRLGSAGLLAAGFGLTTQIMGDPRTFGVQFRARFGKSGE
jgi:iron complex outermembrane receptor protein